MMMMMMMTMNRKLLRHTYDEVNRCVKITFLPFAVPWNHSTQHLMPSTVIIFILISIDSRDGHDAWVVSFSSNAMRIESW